MFRWIEKIFAQLRHIYNFSSSTSAAGDPSSTIAFRIEEIFSKLRHIHDSLSLLLDDNPHLHNSSSTAASGDPSSCSQFRRPFILHRYQWRCLLDAYTQFFRHIDDVLVRILESPLEALLSSMESAERSLKECVAPHIYESVYDRSPDITTSSSFVSTSDPDSRSTSDSYGDGHDKDLTKKQVEDVGRWMMQKVLKHGLGSEVLDLHMDNLRTCAIAALESLTNYSASAKDLGMVLDPETWKAAAEVETGMEKGMDVGGSATSNVEDRDLASAQRFFGHQLRRSISHSPDTLAIARFVLDRISLCCGNTTTATMMERLKVSPTQFSNPSSEEVKKSFNPSSAEDREGKDEKRSEEMLKKKLGKGASGTVLMKKWMVENHLVALKEVEMYTAADAYSGISKIFEGEAETQARLYHPNLLPLLCFTEEARNDYIYVKGAYDLSAGNTTRRIVGLVMELMLYDLESLIEQRKAIMHEEVVFPFPLHVAVDIMLQIAKGMEYLHRNRIMHRDLKPANILISLDSVGLHGDDSDLLVRVKIADFGLSKALASNTSMLEAHTSNVGTSVWRAPEVLRLAAGGDYSREQQTPDPTRYSKKADIYSFAMVCYQVITARVPFDGDKPLRKIQKEHCRPSFDESCPAALVDMIQCCWHPDPYQRPDFAQIANFLSYVKVCALQLVGSSGGNNDKVDKWQKAVAQIVRRRKLFSAFRTNDGRRGSGWKRVIEMCMESRRMIMEEMGYASAAPEGGAEAKPVSVDEESASSSAVKAAPEGGGAEAKPVPSAAAAEGGGAEATPAPSAAAVAADDGRGKKPDFSPNMTLELSDLLGSGGASKVAEALLEKGVSIANEADAKSHANYLRITIVNVSISQYLKMEDNWLHSGRFISQPFGSILPGSATSFYVVNGRGSMFIGVSGGIGLRPYSVSSDHPFVDENNAQWWICTFSNPYVGANKCLTRFKDFGIRPLWERMEKEHQIMDPRCGCYKKAESHIVYVWKDAHTRW